MKSKLASIFLLFTLIAPIVVSFSFLHFQKQLIRKDVKKQIIAGLNKEDLVLFKFTENQADSLLEWEHSKEFKYKDKMYDVVYQQKKDGVTFYWCWDDNAETEVIANLNDLLKRDSKTRENRERLANFFKSLFFSESQKFAFNNSVVERIYFLYQNGFTSIYLFPATPPPINI